MDTQGTHRGGPRPRGGWPNCAKPEVKPGRKIRKARERRDARIADMKNKSKGFDSDYGDGKRVWVRTVSGKVKCHRLPGSLQCR